MLTPREMSIRVHYIKQAIFAGICLGVMVVELTWYITTFGAQIEAFKILFGM